MGRIKNVVEKAEKMRGKINPLYDISCYQLIELYDTSRGIYEALSKAFRVGYMQGMKAAKQETKKRW